MVTEAGGGAAQPLSGVRVIDLTRFVSGSYACMLLAALGADVIKVEAGPDGDPYRSQGTAFVGDESALFQALNTGKRSIVLDLKSESGQRELDVLLSRADVFMENGRPGSLTSIGFDAASVRSRHPHLVYGSVSGYGQTGPEAQRGGFDLILQAEGGIMSVTGSEESGPVKVGAPVLDIGSAVSCALGVVSALYARDRADGGSGVGAHATSSLIEFALACFTSVAPALFVDDALPRPMGSHSPTFAPYGAFRAQDGSLAIAGAGSESLWRRFCDVVAAPELLVDPRFLTNADRVRHLDGLIEEIEERLGRHSVQHWLDRFADAGVPAARVRDLREAMASAQVAHLDLVRTQGAGDRAYRQIGPPFQVDGPLAFTLAAPTLGEHSEEIRAEQRANLVGSVGHRGRDDG